MMPRAAVTLAVTLACAAPMAQATPPDQIILRDELFGISAGHVFVLRKALDNLGLYNSDMRNVALVAIDRKTAGEQIWPVARTHRIPDYDDDLGGQVMTTDQLALPGAVDPFTKLAEMGGYPVFDQSMLGEIELGTAPKAATDAPSGVTLDDGTRFQPDKAALETGVSRSLQEFAEAMGDYPRPSPLSAGDLLIGQDYSEARCTYSGGSLLNDSADAPPAYLVFVTCPPPSQPELYGSMDVLAAMWKLVPAAPAP